MFYIGLDLGQRRDHSAIAVVQKVSRQLLVRHLERVPLGTPYTAVVARVREIVQQVELQGPCALVVDGTGVGAPVVDSLHAARLGCELCAVTITGGDREQGRDGAWSVPKSNLIAGVQILLERGELRISRALLEAGFLVRELLDMRIAIAGNGRVRLGAYGFGEHDDLVIALALSCWRARRGSRLTGI